MTGLLLDTQLLIWAAYTPTKLSSSLVSELVDRRNDIRYSVVSLWEAAIKASLGREDFQVDPSALRRGLLREGFQELPIDVEHVLAVRDLPLIHRDPFDRLLVVQALQERLNLITRDQTLLGYGETVRWAG
ncbi:MAG: type II toxin-antitoxin system VapC family toxin [Cyanobacteriota bacterium]|jgi:PIN domain nuclease of toxin-antitoxin system|nr:type II toxin-antitoxin system VapC family toxin [Cyanobacteriota bacterium]